MDTVKIRVLKSRVIEGGSATGLADALNAFYLEMKDTEAEMLLQIRVADYAVLITYTGGP